MLPDFPKSRYEINEQLRLRMYMTAQAKSPLQSLSKHVTQHEGNLHSYGQMTRKGTRVVTDGFNEINLPIEVKFEDVPGLVGEKLLEHVDALAEEIASQSSKMGYKKLDAMIEEAGTSVDAAGGPPTKASWLKMIEGMDIDLDPITKKPTWVFIGHPVVVETMKQSWGEWEQDPKFVQRNKEIFELKYEDWRDRESRRKLVD